MSRMTWKIYFVRQFFTLRSFLTNLRFDFQTPLSRTFLKTLKKDVLTDLKGKPLRYTRNMNQLQPLSRGANQRSSTDVTVSRMEQDHQISPNMNTRCSFVSDSPSSLFRPVMTGTGPLESRTSLFARKRYIANCFFFLLFLVVTRSLNCSGIPLIRSITGRDNFIVLTWRAY